MVSGVPSLTSMMSVKPRWLAVPEVNFGDHWRARWIREDALPRDAVVTLGYGIVVMEDKGYATRHREEGGHFQVIEGEIPETEKPVAWFKRTVKERTGGTVGKAVLAGYLVCKATAQNPDVEAGTLTVRPVWIGVLKSIKDLGRTSEWERRRYPMNQYSQLLRDEYAVLARYLRDALDQYLTMHAKGEV